MTHSEPVYSLRVSEVFEALQTSPGGLDTGEVEARQGLYGKNVITEQPAEPVWRKILAHLTHSMALLLWAAGLLAFLARDPLLGLVIWIIVLVNAVLSYWREYRAEQAMAMLKRLLPGYARVKRENTEAHISSSEIVPGDILILAEGDNISADARVIEEYGLRVNNSTLTGESMAARKTADASFQEGISEVERPNLVFAGTSVVSGTGKAVVYATGMLSQFGRIARLTQTVKEEPSPLQQELLRITRRIAIVAVVLGGIIFLVGFSDIQLGLTQAFLMGLGAVVAVVPEGLPATITLSLAMAVQRLAQRGVLVKKLSVVETLGTISLICTDKSGTLTQNQMTVRQVWVGGQRLSVTGVGYEPRGKIVPDPEDKSFAPDLQTLLSAAALCNNARLNPPSPEHPQWTSLGDQTEAALKVLALKGGLTEEALQHAYPRIHELPFDARRKRMSTIHSLSHQVQGMKSRSTGFLAGGPQVAFIKGAPREVLHLCTHILTHGVVKPLDEETRVAILLANDDFARGALRVLALARRELPARTGGYAVENVEQDLTFLGLVAMMDPPRPEVSEAVEVLRTAGVRMVMITGDYGLTAESLARRIGMLSGSSTLIVTGGELDGMDDNHLKVLLEQEVIFARMAPEHKLRLVAAYQALGEVVAVTGDGVNDAPALRKADVGVVMGVTGTDVAKEAADVILTNDNFATITSAIEEGRAVYYNLRKFITYIFSSNVPEILPFLLTALSSAVVPLALGVKQILAIDLGTDLFPALALGTEKPEPDVMHKPPRRRTQPLVDRPLLMRSFLFLGLIEAILCYFGFFYVYYAMDQVAAQYLSWLPFFEPRHISPEHRYILARTVFYAGVVMAQVGNAFACRTERLRGRRLGWLSNRLLWVGVIVDVIFLIVLVYSPVLPDLFEHRAIPVEIWIGLISYPVVIYLMDWIRKGIVRWRERTKEVV